MGGWSGGGGHGGHGAYQILTPFIQWKMVFRSFQIWLDHRNEDR